MGDRPLQQRWDGDEHLGDRITDLLGDLLGGALACTVVAVALARRNPGNTIAHAGLLDDGVAATSPTPMPRTVSAPANACMRELVSRKVVLVGARSTG
jgi:hypothetical protein